MAGTTSHLSHNAARGPCAVCCKEGLPCGRCRLDYYCSKEHQRQHWQYHKVGCGALELRHSEELGRHVVFTKDVPQGTAVLRELPLVSVVPPWARRLLFCVGCHAEYQLLLFKCDKCGWPVCSPVCSTKPVHQAECRAFQRAGFKLPQEGLIPQALMSEPELHWTALSALRTHLACEKEPRLRDLQSKHVEVLEAEGVLPMALGVYEYVNRRCAVSTRVRQEEQLPAAARWLRETAGLNWIPEEDLVRAATMNDINGVGLSALNNSNKYSAAIFLFAGVSMLEHHCSPTGMLLALDPDSGSLEQLVVTTKDVKQGDHLSLDYLDAPFQDAVRRRAMLRRGWSFVCRCERCEDPTSAGKHLGCPCCPECKERGKLQLMVPDLKNWSGETLRPEYRCDGCGQTSAVPETAEAEAEADLWKMKELQMSSLTQVSPRLKAASHPLGPLHPTHRIVLNSKFGASLISSSTYALGRNNLKESVWEKYLFEIERMLAVLNAVKPGLNHIRWALLIMKYDFRFTSVQNALERPEPRAPLLGTGRLKILKKRIAELNDVVHLMKPFYFSPGEKERFYTTYGRPAKIFTDSFAKLNFD